MKQEALARAIKEAGGPKALSQKIGVTHQAISQWRECPPLRAIELERLTGIPRHELRPDLYPPNEAAA